MQTKSVGQILIGFITCALQGHFAQAQEDVPKAHDPRLVVERFAANPDIVHPVGIAFDSQGRLLVIESHTHFRPANYQGPKYDRIRILEDTDGDGKADRFTTFFEGAQAAMDIALAPDGSVCVATRNEILRLRDSKGNGKADKQERIVRLDTKGNYPHNGLSGLAFDWGGNLYFGMGENLGAPYQLSGAPGTTLSGEGEGGNVFWCTADGKKLRRVATGFWNPFGICSDIFGRIFAVDNDPDAMPPCRLLHLVEGGDYGYQFRYGRSGRHPFQAWNGQLPGTLPMMSGTGEAPCEIISYESDGLPAEYRGDLLVASWADHRIERYVVTEQGASVKAQRQPFIQGGKDFRPVGIAVAPDGSLFVSDWVLSNYELHGRGVIWRVRWRDASKPDRPTDPRKALASPDRNVREAAARKLLAEGETGRGFLRQQLRHDTARIRAAALTALIDALDARTDLTAIAEQDPLVPIRALAVRALAAGGGAVGRFLDARQPAAVRLEAVAALRDQSARPTLLQLLTDPDPFCRHAAIGQLARVPGLLAGLDPAKLASPQQRMGLLLAHRKSGRPEAVPMVAQFLRDPDPEVRFLAVKWIADEQLAAYRPLVVAALKDPRLSGRLYFAYSSALARIDQQDVSEGRLADFFVSQLTDPQSSSSLRRAALQLAPATHKKLTIDVLAGLLQQPDSGLQLETIRVLNEHPSPQRFPLLLNTIKNGPPAVALQAEALLGLAERSPEHVDLLLGLLNSDQKALRDEALRALVQTKLTPAQEKSVAELLRQETPVRELAARVLGQPFKKDRPKPDDPSAWLKKLEGPADPDAGRRVFFHARLAGCFRCHRVNGRGHDVGPDLSAIGRTERRHILESILQPGNTVAPHYQAWTIATADGKVFTGMLMRTHLDEYTYVDARGALFKLNTRDIIESRPLPTSIMPDNLADLLTDQELRDLLAYLTSRR